jgi:hypothetical protein
MSFNFFKKELCGGLLCNANEGHKELYFWKFPRNLIKNYTFVLAEKNKQKSFVFPHKYLCEI